MLLKGTGKSVDATLADCLETLYAGATDLQARHEFFRAVSYAVGSVGAGIERSSPSGELIAPPRHHDAYVLEPEILAGYVQYASINPFKAIFHSTTQPGSVAFGSDHVELARLHDSEYWQGFMRRFDLGYPARIVPCSGSHGLTICHFAKPVRAGDFTAPERELLQRMAPHLRTFFTLESHIDTLALERDQAWDALERMPYGVFLLGSDRRVRHRNGQAATMEALHDGLACHDGRLRAGDTGANRALGAAIERAADRRQSQQTTLVSLPRAGNRLPYRVVVAPQQLPTASSAVCVIVRDPEQSQDGELERVQEAYGLTPAEAQVALGVALGATLEILAAQHGRSVATARNLLKRAFAKTGTRRQHELAHRLLTDVLSLPSGHEEVAQHRLSNRIRLRLPTRRTVKP